jgi:16S rRNA (guanine527-N7)-methyltransferase
VTGQAKEVRDGIAALMRRYRLPRGADRALHTLLELVVTDSRAPTSVRDARGVLEDHLADSLVALELPQVRQAHAVADIGAGAGFPGLPLAIALPDADVTLVEASGRKCEFIEHAIAASGVANARAKPARAEAWPDGLGAFDLITARAVGPPAVVAEYAAPLLRVGGTAVLWRGRRDPSEEAAAASAAGRLGLDAREPIAVHPYAGARHRNLYLMTKVKETPPGFPRRPGQARKRPLGSR